MRRWWIGATECVLALLLLAGCGAGGGKFDPSRLDPQKIAAFETGKMTEALRLSEEQKPKVQEINLRYATELKNDLAEDGGKFAKARKIKEMQGRKDQEMKGILTPDQYGTYLQLKEEMKEKFKAFTKERRG